MIPTPEQISKMSLEQLNNEIRRLGNIANSRLSTLEKQQKVDTSSGIAYLKKLAGQANPEKASVSTGMADRFSTKKSTNVNVARARLKNISAGLKSKKSTVRGLKESDKQRKKTLSENVFAPVKTMKKVKVYDEKKTGDPKKDKKRKFHYEMRERTVRTQFTDKEYKELIEMLHEANINNWDSETVLQVFAQESVNHKFYNYDDFKEFLEERLPQGTAIIDYDMIPERNKGFKLNKELKKELNKYSNLSSSAKKISDEINHFIRKKEIENALN